VCERFNWRCHGWCQMTNHYHIVIETPDADLSAGMRQLNGVYTHQFNRAHRLVGHLFQGRFKAILVERDAYLLELARYVVLNPARAHMVMQAGDWPWSSDRAMMGLAAPPPWLETDWVLGQFAPDRAQARAGFAGFVAAAGVGQARPGASCAVRSFSAAWRLSSGWSETPRVGEGNCAKYRGLSAAQWRSLWGGLNGRFRIAARRWRALLKPESKRCRRSAAISASTMQRSAVRCVGWSLRG